MKIALFTDTYFPQINGIVTSIAALARGLTERGHQVTLIVPKTRKSISPPHSNVEMKRIRGVPALFYKGFKFTLPVHPGLFRFIRKNKFDVLHFHTPITIGLQAVLMGRVLKIPVIGTFHTFFADSQYLKHAHLDYGLVEKAGWYYSNMFYNYCDLVTCHAQSTRQELIENGCRAPIEIISNGIDVRRIDNSRAEEFRSQYAPDGPLLLFVGRIAHEKNLPMLLNAFADIVAQIPTCRMLLVGEGPQMRDTEKTIATLGLQHNARLLGPIKHDELLRSGIFGASDLFVTASTTENQPMTILESLASGLPCVGPNARGIPDLVQNGINGAIFEPDNKDAMVNAVLGLLLDPPKLQKMRLGALESAQQHSFETVLERWETCYNEIVSQKKK